MASQLDIRIRRGEPFRHSFFAKSRATDPLQLSNVEPLAARFTVIGAYASRFAAGKVLVVSGNRDAATNKTYTVASVSESGGATLIVVTTPANLNLSACDPAADTFAVAGDYLARFYPGSRHYLTGNTGAASANKLYTVASATYNGSATTVRTEEDIPAGATATGSVVTPAIPPAAVVSGAIARVEDDVLDLGTWSNQPKAQLRAGRTVSDSLLDAFTCSTINASTGEFTLSLTAAQTAALTVDRAFFDIVIPALESGAPPLRIPDGNAAGAAIVDIVTALD
jgi:hypothetical protein